MASLCDTMRRQILSRAFYGWLAYCRHLKTVRTHLTSLVYPMSNEFNEIFDDQMPLTVELWTKLFDEKNCAEIFRRIYSAGCDPSIRGKVRRGNEKKNRIFFCLGLAVSLCALFVRLDR